MTHEVVLVLTDAAGTFQEMASPIPKQYILCSTTL